MWVSYSNKDWECASGSSCAVHRLTISLYEVFCPWAYLVTIVEPSQTESSHAWPNACHLYSAGEEDIGDNPNIWWSGTANAQRHAVNGDCCGEEHLFTYIKINYLYIPSIHKIISVLAERLLISEYTFVPPTRQPHKRSPACSCTDDHSDGFQYRIALILRVRRSKFSRIAVFDNFFLIFSRIICRSRRWCEVSKFSSKYFREWHRIRETWSRSSGPRNI